MRVRGTIKLPTGTLDRLLVMAKKMVVGGGGAGRGGAESGSKTNCTTPWRGLLSVLARTKETLTTGEGQGSLDRRPRPDQTRPGQAHALRPHPRPLLSM